MRSQGACRAGAIRRVLDGGWTIEGVILKA